MSRACREHKNVFGAEPGVIALLWRLEDVFPDLMQSPNGCWRAWRNWRSRCACCAEIFRGRSSFQRRHTRRYRLRPSRSGAALHGRGAAPAHRRCVDGAHGGYGRIRILDLNALMIKPGRITLSMRASVLFRQPWTRILGRGGTATRAHHSSKNCPQKNASCSTPTIPCGAA